MNYLIAIVIWIVGTAAGCFLDCKGVKDPCLFYMLGALVVFVGTFVAVR